MDVRDAGLTGNGNISRGLDRGSGSQVGRDTDRLEDRGDGDERLGVGDGELVTASATTSIPSISKRGLQLKTPAGDCDGLTCKAW
jgi:hypothetical protein